MINCVTLGRSVYLSGLPPFLPRAGNTGDWFSIFFSLRGNPLPVPPNETYGIPKDKASEKKSCLKLSLRCPHKILGFLAHPMIYDIIIMRWDWQAPPCNFYSFGGRAHNNTHVVEVWSPRSAGSCIPGWQPEGHCRNRGRDYSFWSSEGSCSDADLSSLTLKKKKKNSIQAVLFQVYLSRLLERMK